MIVYAPKVILHPFSVTDHLFRAIVHPKSMNDYPGSVSVYQILVKLDQSLVVG